MRTLLFTLVTVSLPALAEMPGALRAMEGELLKADGLGAKAQIANLSEQPLGNADQKYVLCVQGRLDNEPLPVHALPAFTSKVLLAYQQYWRSAFASPAKREQSEAILKNSLHKLLGSKDQGDVAALERQVQRRLELNGYHSLLGFTPPLRELLLWRTQSTKMFNVTLPEQTYGSRVVMLDNFASIGWAGWATCDRRSTAGWTTDREIFAVMPRYLGGIRSNDFLAVLLTHETQHFYDKSVFTTLQPWELEYRAKLSELWAADQKVAGERLRKFADSQSDDPALAHPYANARVLADLRTFLGNPPAEADNTSLHVATATLLAADTSTRNKRRESAAAPIK